MDSTSLSTWGETLADIRWGRNKDRLPLEQIPTAIVESNAWNVDSITGATVTSDAIKAAVKDAIVQAGGDPADYEVGAEPEAEATVVNMEADVVVVGAGAAFNGGRIIGTASAEYAK